MSGMCTGLALQRAGALTGQGGAGRTRDAEGHDVVAAYAPVPGTRWTLVSEDDWAAVTSATRRYARILLILLVLGMVLPPLGMGLLVREKNAEMLERERTGQETRVANLIQQRLLPRQAPVLPGWSLAVHYQPATTARGNFHDFLLLPDGRLMLALADVTETGLPAAHVIATTRATLRGQPAACCRRARRWRTATDCFARRSIRRAVWRACMASSIRPTASFSSPMQASTCPFSATTVTAARSGRRGCRWVLSSRHATTRMKYSSIPASSSFSTVMG